MKRIIIGKPYIEQVNGNVRLCSKILENQNEYVMWYEVEKKYQKYLINSADAFLVALFPYAVIHDLDIEINADVSEKLFYQLKNYQIPIMTKAFKNRSIEITANLNSEIYKGTATGTGLSCGIDSFYTISKHINECESFKLTHLTFFNVGASGDFGGDDSRKLFKKRIDKVRAFADEHKLEFVTVDSNISEYIKLDFVATHTFRSMSAALVLGKLFGKYYYSSGHSFNNSHINAKDCSTYDILNMSSFSTESTQFYIAGIETNRIGKIREVVEYEPSYDYLNVCVREEQNCGECEKCLRTLLALDALGKLDLYKSVFDLNKFYKNKKKYLVFMLKKVHKKNEYYMESYECYKNKGESIPLSVYIKSYIPNKQDLWYYLPEGMKKIIRKKLKRG